MNDTSRKNTNIKKSEDSLRRPGLYFSKHQIMATFGVLILAVCLIIGMVWYAYRNELKIDSEKYQAVFLDNDQVFFGKLQNTKGQYLTLKGAYYVQDNSQTPDAKSTDAQESTQLLKVSDTIYGPDDTMSIQSSKVLFWQNLDSDSKVSKAIEEQE